LGYPDQADHSEVQAIIERSIKRIRQAGKAAGFLAVDPAMAHKAIGWDANFVAAPSSTAAPAIPLDFI